jgi:hypothetical protein
MPLLFVLRWLPYMLAMAFLNTSVCNTYTREGRKNPVETFLVLVNLGGGVLNGMALISTCFDESYGQSHEFIHVPPTLVVDLCAWVVCWTVCAFVFQCTKLYVQHSAGDDAQEGEGRYSALLLRTVFGFHTVEHVAVDTWLTPVVVFLCTSFLWLTLDYCGAWWYMFANMSKSGAHWNVGKVSLFNVIGMSTGGAEKNISGVETAKLGFVDSVYHFIGFHATHFAVLYWIFRRMVLTLVRSDLDSGAISNSNPRRQPSTTSASTEPDHRNAIRRDGDRRDCTPDEGTNNPVVVKRIRLNRQEPQD